MPRAGASACSSLGAVLPQASSSHGMQEVRTLRPRPGVCAVSLTKTCSIPSPGRKGTCNLQGWKAHKPLRNPAFTGTPPQGPHTASCPRALQACHERRRNDCHVSCKANAPDRTRDDCKQGEGRERERERERDGEREREIDRHRDRPAQEMPWRPWCLVNSLRNELVHHTICMPCTSLKARRGCLCAHFTRCFKRRVVGMGGKVPASIFCSAQQAHTLYA